MYSLLTLERGESVEQEQASPRRTRRFERVPRPGSEALHLWSVGFSGAAAEQLQRSSERVGRLHRCFGDCWRLVQYVMPCFGGALVRRPDLLIVNADQLSHYDLEWLHEVGGPLPVWKVSSRELLSQSEASLAQRLRSVARACAEAPSAQASSA